MNKGKFFLIIGPSGVGKTTLVKKVIRHFKVVQFQPSYTTRPKRLNEINGSDYHFISKRTFKKLLEENKFLEWDSPFGNQHYGIPKSIISDYLNKGISLIKEIGIKGYFQLKNGIAKEYIISIFIVPDEIEILRKRLQKRNVSEEEVCERITTAKKEVEYSSMCDYTLISYNKDLKSTFTNLCTIVQNSLT